MKAKLVILVLVLSSCDSNTAFSEDHEQFDDNKRSFICQCEGSDSETGYSWYHADTIYAQTLEEAELECSNRATTDLPSETINCGIKE